MKSSKKAICTALSLAALIGFAFVPSHPVAAKPAGNAAAKDGHPIVEMETSKGPIVIQLFQKEAPITSGNFLDLVSKHFYDGLTFHRYEPGFVIQGGDPNGNGSGNYVDPKTHVERHIRLEKVAGLTHERPGMVAMARTSDPNSASCQFYITLAPAPFLDDPPGYAVFGKVIEGMDNVMKLRKGDKILKAVAVR